MEELIAEVKRYIDLRLKYYKLKAVEQLSLGTGKVLSLVAFVILLGLAVMLLSIALAMVVAKWVGSMALAFVIVGAFMLLLGILCLVLRDALFSNAMVKTFSKMFFPEREEDEDEDEF